MNFFFPIAAILAETAGKTVDKFNFSQTKITPRQMVVLVFIVMTVSLALFLLLTGQSFPKLTAFPIVILLLIGITSFASNIFDEISVQADDLSLREPLNDFEPILAGLIGYMLFPAERNPIILMVFLVSILVVYYGTHRRKLRNFEIKGMHFLLLAVIFEAILPSVYVVALEYMNPAYLAFFRLLGVLVFSLLFFKLKPIFSNIDSKIIYYTLAAGIIYAIGAVVKIAAIDVLGVAQTMLILLLGPSMRYLSAYFILKEKVRTGEVISSLILAGLVILTVFV